GVGGGDAAGGVAARAADEPAGRALVDPASRGTGRPEVGVVRMAGDHHEPIGPPAVGFLVHLAAFRPTILLLGALRRVYHSGRGFARLPPRAKPQTILAVRQARRDGPTGRSGAAGRSASDCGLSRVEGCQDVGRVAFGLDLLPGSGDASLGIDEERPARSPHVGPAVVLLLDPRAVGLGDLVVGVGQEAEGEAELLAERSLARGALRADPPDVRAALGDRVARVAELARLDCAARRVGLGI